MNEGAEATLAAAVAAATGRRLARISGLSGGCVAEVFKVALEGGGAVVAKRSAVGGLAIEAFMLGYLRRHGLPVPAVLHEADDLLLLEFVEGSSGLDAAAERHAAELLAALHGVSTERFGFERDTVIGRLPQPNPWWLRWCDFFREHRLLAMGRRALASGNLPKETFARLERLAGRLDGLLEEPPAPGLIHGDVWGGNLLARQGRIAAFLDPAIYFAHPEVELAFATLFGTVGKAFFERYQELRPIAPGFFELRRDLYNLYPLLVHVTLFGGHYPQAVARILARHT